MDDDSRDTTAPDDSPGYGRLAEQWLGQQFRLQVLKSNAGYYIGTADENGLPCSRESDGYWDTHTQAQTALENGQWSQKPTP